MKEVLLISSAGFAVLATVSGMYFLLTNNDPLNIMRVLSASLLLGLLSVSLFFVGWVFPKNEVKNEKK